MTEVRDLIANLGQITFSHFALEEGMMAATHYPGLFLHRLEHQWLYEQTKALEARCRRARIKADDTPVIFLDHVHIDHMRLGDLKFGLWLNGTALPPQQATGEGDSNNLYA